MPVKKAPADDFPNATLGRWKLGLNELRDAVTNLPGASARVPATLDGAGKLTPPAGDLTVDTYQHAAAGFMDYLSLGAVDDGSSVSIAIADAARPITLRNLMASATDPDAGPLLLLGTANQGDELLLSDTFAWLRFQRVGQVFVERERHGFTTNTPIGKQDIDFAGFALTGARFQPVEVFGFPFVFLRRVHLARLTVFQAAGTAGLPDPNDLTSGNPADYWQVGDTLPWLAAAASLVFRQWDGLAPANAAGHDRAFGQAALGACIVTRDASTGLQYWALGGATTTGGPPPPPPPVPPPPTPPPPTPPPPTPPPPTPPPPTPPPPTPPPPTPPPPTPPPPTPPPPTPPPPPPPPPPPGRTWSSVRAVNDTPLANVITWQGTGASLSHAYGANEKWVYFATFGISGAGTTANNAALVRLVRNTGSDLVVGTVGRSRWPTDLGRFGIVYATQYGGSPGNANYRVEAMNEVIGFATTVLAPEIVALRLEGGEDFARSATGANESAGGFVDVVGLPAYTPGQTGSFFLVAGVEANGAAPSDFYDVRLVVDGAPLFPAARIATDGPKAGSYVTVFPAVLTAAPHAISLQIRADLGGATTAQGTNATLAVLDPTLFTKANWNWSQSTQTTSASAFTNRLRESWALKPGWKTLVLGSMQWESDASNTNSGCAAQLLRNGGSLVPDARAGVRSPAQLTPTYLGSWVPSSYFGLRVLQPALTTDVLTLAFGSASGASSVSTAGVGLFALALGP